MPGMSRLQHNGRSQLKLPIADTELCGTAHLVAGRSMTSPGQRPRHRVDDEIAEFTPGGAMTITAGRHPQHGGPLAL
jgi:hypothetical protein